jgi:hypothetical protein
MANVLLAGAILPGRCAVVSCPHFFLLKWFKLEVMSVRVITVHWENFEIHFLGG